MKFHTIPLDDLARCRATPAIGKPYGVRQAMQLALDLAWQGLGSTSPNPIVGAVALDESGKLAAFGFHAEIGGPHAEVQMWESLRSAMPGQRDLSGFHIVVSLEPCAHFGRTPPCAELLGELRPKKVTYLMQDPNPLVASRGAAILQGCGVQTYEFSELSALGRQQNECFIWRQQTRQKVMIGLKAAASLGGIIGHTGDRRQWITGGRAREFGHFLRVRYDAIAVGATTLIQDNSTLDPDLFSKNARSPWKVVIDPNLRAAVQYADSSVICNLLRSNPSNVIWICDANSKNDAHAKEWLKEQRVHVVEIAGDAGKFLAADIIESLSPYPIHSLLLEGGAGLYGAFLDEGLVHRVHYFAAPSFLGDPANAIHIESGRRSPGALRLKDIELTPLGEDLLIEGWI